MKTERAMAHKLRVAAALTLISLMTPAICRAADKKPNILVIWGDDIGIQGNIATAVRDVPGWPVLINLRADPYEKAPHESGMYFRWYADNIWLFVLVQQKLKAFLTTLPQYPFQQGSSLNAANINYTSIQAMQATKPLQELENLSPPNN